MSQKIILDFDDFSAQDNGLDILFRMKSDLPNLKVTMFAVPMKGTLSFWREVRKLDWIRLGMHGFHHTWLECEKWSKHEADAYIRTVMGWTAANGTHLFDRLWKAPQWRNTQPVMDAVIENGLMVALNPDPASNPHGVTVPDDVRKYYFTGDKITGDHSAGDWVREHGHIGPKDCSNELSYTYHHLMEKFHEDDEFAFITDAVNELYEKDLVKR